MHLEDTINKIKCKTPHCVIFRDSALHFTSFRTIATQLDKLSNFTLHFLTQEVCKFCSSIYNFVLKTVMSTQSYATFISDQNFALYY